LYLLDDGVYWAEVSGLGGSLDANSWSQRIRDLASRIFELASPVDELVELT
jgi:hypothetical protein